MVSGIDVGVEALSSQSVVPAQEHDPSLAGVRVLNICRGAWRWVQGGVCSQSLITSYFEYLVRRGKKLPVTICKGELGLLAHWTPRATAWTV